MKPIQITAILAVCVLASLFPIEVDSAASEDAIAQDTGNQAEPIVVKRAVVLKHPGHLLDSEKSVNTLLMERFRRRSLTMFPHQIESWLVESGVQLEPAKEVSELVVEASTKSHAELQQLILAQSLLGEQLEGKEKVAYADELSKRLVEREEELTSKIVEILGEQADSLGRVLFRQYPSTEFWTHPYAIRMLELTEAQVSAIRSIERAERKALEESLEGRGIDEYDEIMKKNMARVDEAILDATNVLTIEQIRKYESISGRMEEGQRWSDWIKQFPKGYQRLILARVPKIESAIAGEGKSGIILED